MSALSPREYVKQEEEIRPREESRLQTLKTNTSPSPLTNFCQGGTKGNFMDSVGTGEKEGEGVETFRVCIKLKARGRGRGGLLNLR